MLKQDDYFHDFLTLEKNGVKSVIQIADVSSTFPFVVFHFRGRRRRRHRPGRGQRQSKSNQVGSVFQFVLVFFKKKASYIFNILFHNSHDKIDRQIMVSNQINPIES